ncbi:SGNH/GDSL hydrolase family protein [Glaciecola sp. SC05]|uniref:SGNH/GDSL hydrolase family protein n=1 Tax=Glaciecola sp. SC05 TaxID=1987355 RepID=UPI00352703E4
MTKYISASLLLFMFSGSLSAAPISSFISFGDSLSDTGNVSLATGGFPPPPYASGRFTSNFTDGSAGVVWYDLVANQLGFPSTNSLAGGNNYAWGGARIAAGGSVPSLVQQSFLYLSDVGGVADENALYSIFGGGNDIRDNNIGGSVAGISAIITNLHAAGAKNFFVPNALNIGLTPESQAGLAPGGPAPVITAASIAFNAQLQNEMQVLRTNLGINIIELDLFSLFEDVNVDPASFGFSNIIDPCFNQAVGTLCADPDSYLFFDGIHPTAAGHTLLANFAIDAIMDAMDVSAPATLVIFLSGLAVVGFRRKKA